MLLVGIDFERLTAARGFVGDSLGWQIYFDFHLRVFIDAIEQLLQEGFAHHDRQDKVVQFIVLVDIGKEAADHHAEAISGNRPRSMFAA